ncbi:MAG: hypothetical protein ACYCW6_18905 [Candidatus Xenobia bacterium]
MERRTFLKLAAACLLVSPPTLAASPAWNVVGGEVAEQVLRFLRGGPASLGSFVIDQMLGPAGDSRVVTLSDQALASVKHLVDESLRRDDFNRTLEDFSGISEIFKQYHATPEERKDVIDRVSIVIGHLQALPDYALPSYTLAVNLKLAAQGMDSDAPKVRQTAGTSHDHVTTRLSQMQNATLSRFSDVAVTRTSRLPGFDRLERVWHAAFDLDGSPHWQGRYHTEEEAFTAGSDALAAARDALLSRTVRPFSRQFSPILTPWSALAEFQSGQLMS